MLSCIFDVQSLLLKLSCKYIFTVNCKKERKAKIVFFFPLFSHYHFPLFFPFLLQTQHVNYFLALLLPPLPFSSDTKPGSCCSVAQILLPDVHPTLSEWDSHFIPPNSISPLHTVTNAHLFHTFRHSGPR